MLKGKICKEHNWFFDYEERHTNNKHYKCCYCGARKIGNDNLK